MRRGQKDKQIRQSEIAVNAMQKIKQSKEIESHLHGAFERVVREASSEVKPK